VTDVIHEIIEFLPIHEAEKKALHSRLSAWAGKEEKDE
jgi:hypothetical protein